MTAQAFQADNLARPTASTRTLARYRLDVVASDARDVIQSAGGWMFDRAMAGWDVNVLVTHGCDARPLQILGAATLPFDSLRAGPVNQMLGVAADAFATEACVREVVLAALDRGAEVTLWGQRWPAELAHRVDAVQHRLSSAAQAFKAQALAAAAIAHNAVGPIENYRSRAGWHSPLASDLAPVG